MLISQETHDKVECFFEKLFDFEQRVDANTDDSQTQANTLVTYITIHMYVCVCVCLCVCVSIYLAYMHLLCQKSKLGLGSGTEAGLAVHMRLN